MSASTRSNTGSAATSAGGRSPAWWSSAARPSVFSATVLPPVFGPLTTSARRSPRSRSIGTAAAGSSSGCRAPSSRTSSETSTGAPRQPRESVPHATREVDLRGRLDERRERLRARPDRGRELAQDPLDLLALRAGGLGLAVVQLDDLERLDEERLARAGRVVDDPRHAAARARLHREHRAAAALGDEVLLQVLAERGVAREPAQLLGDAVAALAQLPAQPPEERRGVVAEVGAVLLDAALDRVGERRERRVDRRGELPEQRREVACLVERAAQREAAAHGRARPRERVGREHAAARRELGRLAHVRDPLERRLRGVVEQRDGLRRQRLPPRDLVRLGRGRRARARAPAPARRRRPRAASRSAIAGKSSASSASGRTRRVYERATRLRGPDRPGAATATSCARRTARSAPG